MTRAALALLALTLAAPAAAQEKGRKVAFLVGVGAFRHDLSDLGASPKKDATELGRVLKDGGFEVVVLTDKDATKADIEGRFKKLVDGNGSVAKGDLLLVALCTHGFALPPAAGQPDAPFLAAHDSKLNKPDTMVSLNGLIADGKTSGATVLYLIDACRELPKDANRGFEPDAVTLPKGTAVLFSCGRGQVSHQHKDARGHGLFTFAVLTTLAGDRGIRDDVSWNGLVLEVERAFKSPEFQTMIPPGKPQRPFVASGELAATELMRVPVSIEADERAYEAAVDRGGTNPEVYLQTAAPHRLARWRELAEKGNPKGQFLYGVCFAYGTGVPTDHAEAVKWLRKAADAGHAAGMTHLGVMYQDGHGLPKDEAEAVKWFRKAAVAGHVAGMVHYGFARASGVGGLPKDAAEAVRWYRKAADAGDTGGSINLGDSYRDGDGVAKNLAEAVKWYRKAADAGDTIGMTRLAVCYRDGDGVAQNPAEAVRWFRKAADAGDTDGMTSVGWAYASGYGLVKDEKEAAKWYRRAAEGGKPDGMYWLAHSYEHGVGVAKNLAEAVRWYRKAAEADNTDGMHRLAHAYEHGDGVAKNAAEAVRWYRKADDAGHPQSTYTLGAMYAEGRNGLKQDDAEAVRLFRKAAEAGDSYAMGYLGTMYEDGRGGLKPDDAEAVKWYKKAADAGNATAMNNLAVMHATGRGGLKQDDAEAARWYKKAADAELPMGIYHLGVMYENGRGVPRNLATAVKLYKRAAELGVAEAKASLKRLGKD